MEAILIPLFFFSMIFGIPVTLRFMKYRHEEKMKELEARKNQPQPKALGPGNDALDERLKNLESIVCSVDFELNAKLNRLASRQMLGGMSPSQSLADTKRVSGAFEAGQRVANRFVIERALGQGGMGAVYLARDEQLGEQVALKVVAGFGLLDPSAADRLRHEASAARRISHGNVVRLHDIGEEKGLLFLSMEYVPGQSLGELLTRHGVLPLPQAANITAQICDGLSAAHAAGVIHRDLKPSNVLLDENQRVKIIDFGLARLPHLEGMTATNMIVGTPEYMAPEQIRGGTIDPRTDIYALGAVLYHGLSGRPPFVGETPIAVGLAHCVDEPRPLRELRPDATDAWQALIQRALAKDPAQRFGSVSELRAQIPSA